MAGRIKLLQIGFVVYAILVAIFSLLPAGGVSRLGDLDKLIHFAIYFVMAIFAMAAFRSRKSRTAALFVTFTLGALLELGQGFVDERAPSYFDGLANVLGAALGVYAFQIWDRRRQSKGLSSGANS